MIKILHISANTYPNLDGKEHHTKKIWKELAKDVSEYHVLARSQCNFSHTVEGNIHLHLIPKQTHSKSRVFILSSWLCL